MSEPLDITLNTSRWRILPEHRDRLLGPDGLRLDDWRRDGLAEVVKHAAHRTVYRVRLPDLCFYVKHNRLADARAWLRSRVRQGKALAEFERARALLARGVPAVVPLAAGQAPGGDDFLVTLALDGARPLNHFLEIELPTLAEPRRTHLRQRIASALGALLARMHDAGLRHDDLHPGNLLLCLDDADRPSLHLVDLHAVALGASLGQRVSLDNLAVLNRWFFLRASRADRLRCWLAYCASRSGGGYRPIREEGRELERRTLESVQVLWRSLDARCRENNRRYRRMRSAVAAGHAVADLDAVTLQALLADPDEPFRRPGVKLLKDSRSSTVADLELTVGGERRAVIWKRFRVTSWKDPWLALLRPTAAQRSWVNGQAMRLRWLPTPRPLLMLHRKRHGLSREGYLLTMKIPDAEELQACVHRLLELPERERRPAVRSLIDDVARLVRDLHGRGMSHRDLKAPNLLVVRDPKPCPALGEPVDHWPLTGARVWFVDLVGVRPHVRVSRTHRVQNLARLHASFVLNPGVSRTDKLRFLRVYLQSGLHGRADWKDWWRRVDAATRVKIARNARSGRVLA